MGEIARTIQVVSTKQNGKKLSKSITHANPAAANVDLKTFADAYGGLSENTLDKIYKVDKKNITPQGN